MIEIIGCILGENYRNKKAAVKPLLEDHLCLEILPYFTSSMRFTLWKFPALNR